MIIPEEVFIDPNPTTWEGFPKRNYVYLLWFDQSVVGVYLHKGDAIEAGNLMRSTWRVERRLVG